MVKLNVITLTIHVFGIRLIESRTDVRNFAVAMKKERKVSRRSTASP